MPGRNIDITSGNLFAYGTLLLDDIFLEVAGCRCRRSRATLDDHLRLRVRGEVYPGLIPSPGFRVEGLVYHDVPLPAWDRLDRFEGEVYERQAVTVKTAGGRPCPAQVYIVRPACRDLLEPRQWDPEEFVRSGGRQFLQARYTGNQGQET